MAIPRDKFNEEYHNGFTMDPSHKHQENINRMIGIKPLDILKKYNVMDRVAIVTIEQSAEMYLLHKDEEGYKQAIRSKIVDTFAIEAMKKSTFTCIKVPPRHGSGTFDDQIRVIGRCVILSIDDFARILQERYK